jgi:hypothetical protein
MKYSKYFFYFFTTLLVAGAISGCEKNTLRLTEFDLPTDKAYARFAFFSPNSPAVMIKINDIKINGSNTSGNGGAFPSVINVPDYAAVPPNGTMRLSLPNIGTNNDSVLIFSGNIGLEQTKFYSVTLADTGVDRTLFSVEDVLPPVQDSGFFTIRIVNAMPKSPAISLIRVDSASASVVTRDTIVRNLAYKGASNYVKVPISGVNANVRFRIFNAGGLNLAQITTPTATGNQSVNRRSVTIYASGFSGATGTLAPALSSAFYNK